MESIFWYKIQQRFRSSLHTSNMRLKLCMNGQKKFYCKIDVFTFFPKAKYVTKAV